MVFEFCLKFLKVFLPELEVHKIPDQAKIDKSSFLKKLLFLQYTSVRLLLHNKTLMSRKTLFVWV